MQENPITINDLMIPFSNYPQINHNDTLEDAVNLMYSSSQEKGYRWVVVLDDDDNIAGFLTLRSLLETIKRLAPIPGDHMGMMYMFQWEGMQAIKNTKLKNCLRTMVNVFVYENDFPSRAAELMLKHRVTIIPVFDESRQVTGVIRPVDLLPFFKELFEHAPTRK